ncbi:type II toxin-antitoxin system VapC family toxin [Neorhizobium sp. P12A]|uniref:type II toxin-antitoxin system VapC family toxin n=1 Tax=Neorhizobium sp. P12A TaxID=2268027 RepID=UPI0011ECB82B|nr:type II toxin-antitoxin system VapC family toxin [Neorhizobium sp. P12A]KAA0700985.1 type II toxin-antitoxin system VapC family toxin [Neorhizobium sp. P12A]
MRYLLDTNIVSDVMHNPQGRVVQRIAQVGEDLVFTSILVVSEIRFGIAKSQSKRLAKRLVEMLDVFPVEKFEGPADEHYAVIRAALEGIGRKIGQMDMLIAGHALALDAVLVTANEGEFSRVPGLKVENWLR